MMVEVRCGTAMEKRREIEAAGFSRNFLRDGNVGIVSSLVVASEIQGPGGC